MRQNIWKTISLLSWNLYSTRGNQQDEYMWWLHNRYEVDVLYRLWGPTESDMTEVT